MSKRDGKPAVPATEIPVRPGEDPWDEGELIELVAQLEAEVERLAQELRQTDAGLTELLRNSGDGAGDDQADSGALALEREQNLTFVNNTRDLLVQSEHALSRLDDGVYGICEFCGEAVGKARLQAFPRATLCVMCKQREERR